MYTDSTGGQRDSRQPAGTQMLGQVAKENTHFPEMYAARGSGTHLVARKVNLACGIIDAGHIRQMRSLRRDNETGVIYACL